MPYSLCWAERIVKAFCDRYGRATCIVKSVSCVSTHKLATLLSERSTLWEDFKRLTKQVHQVMRFSTKLMKLSEVRPELLAEIRAWGVIAYRVGRWRSLDLFTDV